MLLDVHAYVLARPNLPVLRFYDTRNPHGHYSNFSPHKIWLDDLWWPTTEHAFQAYKSLDPVVQKQVREQASPGKAKYLGGSLRLRPDWEAPVRQAQVPPPWGADIPTRPDTRVERFKDLVMWRALKAKFRQHSELYGLLLTTDDAILIEAAETDPYWGWGPSHTGANQLGFLLMELRDELRG